MKNKLLEGAIWFVLFESIFWTLSSTTIWTYWMTIKNTFTIPHFWDVPMSQIISFASTFAYHFIILSISIFCFYKFTQCLTKVLKK